uniref:Secreted protein n=1 Tax=Mesocestoides corti TaxID=53468 RepID=A0A5K3FCQ1_MESCO
QYSPFCCTGLVPTRARVFYSGVGSGRRHVGPPGLSQSRVSAIQWHAVKEGSQPEKDMDEMQYIMSGVASVADSDGRRLTSTSLLSLCG